MCDLCVLTKTFAFDIVQNSSHVPLDPYIVFITMSTCTSTVPRNSRSLTFIIRLAVPMTSTKSRLCVQINEIVTTGKLSKLEHFENDEKVMHNMICTCSATFVNINIIHFEGTDHQFIW